MISTAVQLFPLWAILLSGLAYWIPDLFTDGKDLIIPLLTLVMLGMGLTLNWSHFKQALRQPVIITLTLVSQFLFMPLLAVAISRLMHLSEAQTIGMVLVGTSAGGTASNVICYLAKADVALSILLTLSSTLCAVIAMPLLTYLYLQQSIDVPVVKMLTSIVQIVLIPVLAGTTLNTLFSTRLQALAAIFPLLSTLSIVLIIAIIVAINQENIAQLQPGLIFAVALHNLSGLLAGYLLARMLGYDQRICRTVCIEVGMQNSGLSVALAIKYFSAAAALPGAIFSIWHNLSGALLTSFWHYQQRKG